MKYHVMGSNDIRINLATEEYLMNNVDVTEPTFLLYIQNPCVIIGRNQNAYEEVDYHYLREHEITLTRRISGGGAVYDDLGNVSFSFVMNKADTTFGKYQEVAGPILKALHNMGAKDAEAGGRNDLYINGRKFSGNAMYSKNGRTYSHGTLMYDVDLAEMTKVLTVSQEKFTTKATKSVRKAVTNVKPYLAPDYQFATTEEFRDELIRQVYGVTDLAAIADKRIDLTTADQQAIEKLVAEKYANDQWIFGEAPDYQFSKRRRIPKVGIIDIRLDVEEGKIRSMQILGDYFGVKDSSELAESLIGRDYLYDEIAEALADVDLSEYFLNLNQADFLDILFGRETV